MLPPCDGSSETAMHAEIRRIRREHAEELAKLRQRVCEHDDGGRDVTWHDETVADGWPLGAWVCRVCGRACFTREKR